MFNEKNVENSRVLGVVQTLLSQKATSKQRRIDEVLERLGDSDTLIVMELSQLGRSTLEAIAPGSLLNKFIPLTYKGILYFCYRKFSVAYCDSNVCTTPTTGPFFIAVFVPLGTIPQRYKTGNEKHPYTYRSS